MGLGGGFSIILFPLYYIARYVYFKIQKYIWILNGVHQSLIFSRSAEGHNSCVHVQDIWMRYAFDEMIAGQKEDFLTTHNHFTSPKALLADNVTLYHLTSSDAIFVKTDPSVNVYDSNISGFLKVSQYRHAKQLLTMPLKAFNQFAEDLGDPKESVLLISNTGRCGSTLLCQIFEATGEVVAISEPMAYEYPCYFPEKFSQDDLSKIICNVLRVVCKPQGHKKSLYVIKASAVQVGIVPIIMKAMPQVQHIFLYRDLWSVIKSFYRISSGGMFPEMIMKMLMKIMPMGEDIIESSAKELLGSKFPQVKKEMKKSLLEMVICVAAASVFQYLHFLEQGLAIKAFSYDDLMANSQQNLEVLFHYCNLPPDLVTKGMKAMANDSQKGLSLSRASSKHGKNLGPYEGRNKKCVEKIFKMFNIPASIYNEMKHLPETLSN